MYSSDSYHGLGSRRRRTLQRGKDAALKGSGPFSKTSGVSSATAKAARLLLNPPPAPPPPPSRAGVTPPVASQVKAWAPSPTPPAVKVQAAVASSASYDLAPTSWKAAPPPKASQFTSVEPPSPAYDPFSIVDEVVLDRLLNTATVTFAQPNHSRAVVNVFSDRIESIKIGGAQLAQVEAHPTDQCVLVMTFRASVDELEPFTVKDFIEALF
jgi:hypothetical protein